MNAGPARFPGRPVRTPGNQASGAAGVRRGRGLLAILVLGAAVLSAAGESRSEVLRVVFSRTMFSDVNLNDARAAIKVWAEAAARDLEADITPSTEVLEGARELRQGLKAGTIDAAVTPVTEFLPLESEFRFDPIFIAHQDGQDFEELVLLVHDQSPHRVIEDLDGSEVILWQSARSCLAEIWLQSLLRGTRRGRSPASSMRLSREEKLSAAILPVFFRQKDACVVTRRAWQTMGDLNPQVTLQLREVAASPRLVMMVLFFRPDYRSASKDKVMRALEMMPDTPGGRQLLTLFRGDGLRKAPPSALDSARQLHAQAGAAVAANAPAERRVRRAATIDPGRRP